MLERSGHWAEVDAAKAASFPTVTEAALAVKENAGTQAAFIWDSVARQFGLRVVELPELAASKADISVAVTAFDECDTVFTEGLAEDGQPDPGTAPPTTR